MELDSTDVEAKTFDVVRKGYDQTQVGEFLERVGDAMSRTDERRKIAEVRAEQLEREFHEVKARADATIQETVAARVRLLDQKSAGTPASAAKPSSTALVNQAKIEAQQILEQANVRATALQAEAEAIIEGALATSSKINHERDDLLGSTEAERTGLIAAAATEASAITGEAMLAAEHEKAEAARHIAEIRHKAEADADRLAADAKTRALKITAKAEQQRDDLLISVEQSRHRLEEIDHVVEVSETIDAPEPTEDVSDATEELEQLTVDLREQSIPEDPFEDDAIATERTSRPSRYKARSANLPHLGEDATSVIGSLGNLRAKD
ncbi:MAG: DivIVA domain-containing protein [Actinomycetia bacterium]|nr:DivIVA domain-containing protein [Actinomycetes bacterium]